VRIRAVPAVAVLAVLLAVTACAQTDGGTASPPPTTAPASGADDLVLQVAWTGGFVTPQLIAGRLPLLSVYGDGRVITQGPVIAIYPTPALPNLQVQHIDAAAVQALVDRAVDAGVGEDTDFGTPGVADDVTTRFTVSTGLEVLTTDVYALGTSPDDGMLTADQNAARRRMQDLLDALDDLPGTLGTDAVSDSEAYVPTAVAALVEPYTPADDGLTQPDATWPGPALPGDPFEPRLGLSCVVATGDAASTVLDAARPANVLTPWLSADGARWSVALRPLLPDESGCTDLRGA
jgi:hypothetical protein